MSGACYVCVLGSRGKEGQIGQTEAGHLRLEGQLEGEMHLRQHRDGAREVVGRKRRKCFDHNVPVLRLCLNLIP